MSLVQKFIRGASWQFVSQISQGILQLVVLAVLARLLNAKEFGQVAIASMSISFLAMGSQVGLGPSIIQKKNLTNDHVRVAFTFSVFFGVLLVSSIWYGSSFIANYFHDRELEEAVRGVSIAIFITSFGVVAESLLQKELEFKKIMLINLFSYLFGYTLFGVALAVYGFGAWSLIGALIAQNSIKSIMLLSVRPHPVRPLISYNYAKDMLYFGSGCTLSTVFNEIALQADNFIVGRMLGTTALGAYQLAFQIRVALGRYLGTIMTTVLFPALSHISDERQKLSLAFLRCNAFVAIIMIPACVFIIINANPLVSLIFGAKWAQIVTPMQFLVISTPMGIFIRITDSFMTAHGKIFNNALWRVCYAALIIIGSYVGQHWGITGVAAGVTVVTGFLYIANTVTCLRMFGIKYLDYAKALFPAILIGSFVIICGIALKVLAPAVTVPIISLTISVLFSLVTTLVLLLSFPKILGNNGLWMINQFLNMIKSYNGKGCGLIIKMLNQMIYAYNKKCQPTLR